MTRYCSGYSRSRPKCDDLEFGPSDVECPVCGTMDNHCRHRRGLCLICYCALANKVGDEAFSAMEYAELLLAAEAAVADALRRGSVPITHSNCRHIRAFSKMHGIVYGKGFKCDAEAHVKRNDK